MIRIGVCGSLKQAPLFKQAGFDYFEGTVAEILCPLEDDATFAARLEALQQQPLPCEALNCMIPKTLKIVGPDVAFAALEDYVAIMCARAPQTGVRVIVFGSGGARQIPAEFDPRQAQEQLVRFLQMVGPKAGTAGIEIAIEPLNRGETNSINTAAEGAELARRVGHPAIRLLVDGYHLLRESEPPAVIVREIALLAHMHVATRANRLAPGLEPCAGLPEFFAAVKASGYRGRMSVEGKFGDDMQASLAKVCVFLRDELR